MSDLKTVYLRQGQSQRVQIERVANAAITPGHLIELMSTNKFRVHATVGGSVTPLLFAMEDENQGNDIDDAYAATDLVIGIIPQRGDFIQAILKDGENVAIGDKLESAGSGLLQKHVHDDSNDPHIEEQIVGIAMETMNLSSSSGADALLGGLVSGGHRRIWIMIV